VVQVGFKLFAEGYGPQELVRQAVRAEEAGFDFVEISDHYHPWPTSHSHSGFAWSVLAAIAARTEHIELATGVTCPFIRYQDQPDGEHQSRRRLDPSGADPEGHRGQEQR
jgi:alkanesulfonate monooxygenase SsuD/methylene tetrahydromethanopterin reductase-like flavin-dependent oxidoreductase (luciferase family)